MSLAESTLAAIDDQIASRHLLKHSFYQMWTRGELSRDALKGYARQYYKQVEAFPLYVAGVYAHCHDVEARREVLENLVEEDRGPGNHLGPMARVCRGNGQLSRGDL